LTDLFTETWESGSLSGYTVNTWNGDCAVLSGVPVHGGSYSLRSLVSLDTGWGVVSKNFAASYAHLFLQYWLYLDSESISDGQILVCDGFNYGVDWLPQMRVGVAQVSGNLRWSIGYGNGAGAETWTTHSTMGPTLDTWYKLKGELVRDASAGEVHLSIGGSRIISVTGVNTGSNNPTRWEVGIGDHIGQNYIDDILVTDVDPDATGVTVKKGSCVPAMTALLSKFSALRQPREPRFQPRTFPKFTPRTLI